MYLFPFWIICSSEFRNMSISPKGVVHKLIAVVSIPLQNVKKYRLQAFFVCVNTDKLHLDAKT
jgi:hypothetical protein